MLCVCNNIEERDSGKPDIGLLSADVTKLKVNKSRSLTVRPVIFVATSHWLSKLIWLIKLNIFVFSALTLVGWAADRSSWRL